MKLMFAVALTLISGIAHAAQPEATPVVITSAQKNDVPGGRWVEYRDVSHASATKIIDAAEKALGGICHELSKEQIVVCFYSAERTAGINWNAVGRDRNAH